MLNRLARLYRCLVTGAMFLVFMLWGLFLSLLVFPLIYLVPIPRRRKQDAALAVLHRVFSWFGPIAAALGALRSFRVAGLAHLVPGQPCLIIANHPSLIDIVCLMGAIPRCGCIVKRGLWYNPVTAVPVRAAGLIPNDEAEALIAQCQASFAAGRSLVIFPEGTRSPHGGLHSFTRGAAQIALRCGVPVVPAYIHCDPPTLAKGEPWYRVPARAIDFWINIEAPLTVPAEVAEKNGIPLQVRAFTKHLHQVYARKMAVDTIQTPDAP